MKKARMNIAQFRFILFNLKVFGKLINWSLPKIILL